MRAGDATILRWLGAPALGWLGVFFFLPLLIVFLISFASRGLYGGVAWDFTWANYAALADPLYLWIYARSISLAGLTTACCLALGFPFAHYIARQPGWRQAAWLLLLLVPFWTNFLVRTYAWIFILRTEGLLNMVLLALHVITEPLEILYSDTAILIGLIYGYLPFMVFPLYTALSRLDRSVVEAAWDLYATPWAVFWRVLVPLARPGIIAGCILVFVPALGAFITPDLLGGARSMMVGNLIQHEFLVVRDWPLGAAASFVLMAMVLLGVAAYMRIEGRKI